MNHFTPNPGFPTIPNRRFMAAGWIRASLCLLFLAGLMGGAAAGADAPRLPAASAGPRLSFSVADFDGDLRPDVASVQAGESGSSRTDYWIRLQLSAAGRQSFQIVAPVGGLEITARDVNGDHALDLVLTTTWLRQPVAILLNDGHGSFSRVDPAAFPEASSKSEASWGSATGRSTEALGLPPQSRGEIGSETEIFLHLRPQIGVIAFSESRFGGGLFLISHPGRAPPFEVSLS